MKKVLHISKYYYPYVGGVEQIARECVNALQSGNVEQKIICFNHETGDVIDNIDGVDVIRCGCQMKISSQSMSFSYKKRLEDVIESFSPNIIIFHYPNPFVTHFLLQLIKRTNIELYVYWHLDITKQKILKNLFHGQNHRLLERAKCVIVTSPNYVEGSQYLSMYREKCRVVPNCINSKRMNVSVEISEKAENIKKEAHGKTICLAVGRHTEYKGLEYLIRASKILSDDFIIYITGKGELTEKLHALAEGDSKVRFLGLVQDDDLTAYLLAADIFCFPSITKNEAFGVALAEAMYLEKPAVTFTIQGSGVNYVCIDGEDGIEVPNRDVKKYAEAIEKLAGNPSLRLKMGKNGKKRVQENFLDTKFKENIRNTVNID